MKSLVGVMEKVTSDEERRKKVWGRVLDLNGATPSSYLDEVYSKYTTAKEKTHALADVYINIRPGSSWQHLVKTLYAESEMAAAKEAKSFLQQNGTVYHSWKYWWELNNILWLGPRSLWKKYWLINPRCMCEGYGSRSVCVCVCVCVCYHASCYISG